MLEKLYKIVTFFLELKHIRGNFSEVSENDKDYMLILKIKNDAHNTKPTNIINSVAVII